MLFNQVLMSLPNNEQNYLIRNSVHSLQYLWLHKQDNLNYFNFSENDSNLTKLYEIFPVFKKADDYFKSIHKTAIKEFNLDDQEYSLLSSLIMLVGGMFLFFCGLFKFWYWKIFIFKGYKGGNLTSSTLQMKHSLSNDLTHYMFKRREEYDTCQNLIVLLPHYNALHLILQKGIRDKCKDLAIEQRFQLPDLFKNFFLQD